MIGWSDLRAASPKATTSAVSQEWSFPLGLTLRPKNCSSNWWALQGPRLLAGDLFPARPPNPLYPLPPFGVGANMAFRREALASIGGFDVALEGERQPWEGGTRLP